MEEKIEYASERQKRDYEKLLREYQKLKDAGLIVWTYEEELDFAPSCVSLVHMPGMDDPGEKSDHTAVISVTTGGGYQINVCGRSYHTKGRGTNWTPDAVEALQRVDHLLTVSHVNIDRNKRRRIRYETDRLVKVQREIEARMKALG